jgi:hypothetical protein
MSNNFKKIALGLLALILFGACSTETKEEVGRYVPIVLANPDLMTYRILDTKTGKVYNYQNGKAYYKDLIKDATPEK